MTSQPELALFCPLIRVGSYQAVAAAASDKQLFVTQNNVLLHTDRLELLLTGLPRLLIPARDIRDVWYYSGRSLPKSMLCLLLEDHVVQHGTLVAILERGGAFSPTSKDLSVKFVSLFSGDKHAADFKKAINHIPWITRGHCLSASQAAELVLATAGKKASGLSFSLDTLQPVSPRPPQLVASPFTSRTVLIKRRRRDKGLSLLKPVNGAITIQPSQEDGHSLKGMVLEVGHSGPLSNRRVTLLADQDGQQLLNSPEGADEEVFTVDLDKNTSTSIHEVCSEVVI